MLRGSSPRSSFLKNKPATQFSVKYRLNLLFEATGQIGPDESEVTIACWPKRLTQKLDWSTRGAALKLYQVAHLHVCRAELPPGSDLFTMKVAARGGNQVEIVRDR